MQEDLECYLEFSPFLSKAEKRAIAERIEYESLCDRVIEANLGSFEMIQCKVEEIYFRMNKSVKIGGLSALGDVHIAGNGTVFRIHSEKSEDQGVISKKIIIPTNPKYKALENEGFSSGVSGFSSQDIEISEGPDVPASQTELIVLEKEILSRLYSC